MWSHWRYVGGVGCLRSAVGLVVVVVVVVVDDDVVFEGCCVDGVVHLG